MGCSGKHCRKNLGWEEGGQGTEAAGGRNDVERWGEENGKEELGQPEAVGGRGRYEGR